MGGILLPTLRPTRGLARLTALTALFASVAVLAAGCGGQNLSSLGVYLCTTITNKNGVCPASTHTLKTYSKQDIVVNAPNGFGTSSLNVTIDRRGKNGTYSPYDSTIQPVGPSTDSASGPAFAWGSHPPWAVGNYRITVQDGSLTLGSWDFTVTSHTKP